MIAEPLVCAATYHPCPSAPAAEEEVGINKITLLALSLASLNVVLLAFAAKVTSVVALSLPRRMILTVSTIRRTQICAAASATERGGISPRGAGGYPRAG